MISLRIWRAMYGRRTIAPLFDRKNRKLSVWRTVMTGLGFWAVVFFIGITVLLAPLYSILFGYLILNRTRSQMYRLTQLGVYDQLAVTTFGPVGVWGRCLKSSFYNDIIFMWRVYLGIVLIPTIVGLTIIVNATLGLQTAEYIVFLPLLVFLYADHFLSLSLGGLVAITSAAYGLTTSTRFVAEVGYIGFKLISYPLFYFSGFLFRPLFEASDTTFVVGLSLMVFLYIAIYEAIHRLLWYLLGRRVGDERDAIGSFLGG